MTVYWSASWARILNVQGIIKKRTKETDSSIFSTCIPSITISGAGQHLFKLAYDVPGTEDVGLPTEFRFNVGPASQPIAGSIPVNGLWCWLNTNSSLGLLYTLRKYVASTQCSFNVNPQSSLARHWNSIGWFYVFSDCCIMRGAFHPDATNSR